MIEKHIHYSGRSDKGIFTFVIDTEHGFLCKTAAEYHPEVAEYIRNAKPILGKTQILLTALGSSSFWGNNVNGDAFPEEALSHRGSDYGVDTFKVYAKVYKHHVNKDPNNSYGDVVLAVYNPTYHRVELIIALDNAKCPEEVAKANAGEHIDFSMGCRVPWDECSICGNRAPTTKQYCEHLKYYMGRIHPPTGKMAFAVNRFPKFFDISIVLIGADRIAKSLLKVASLNGAKIAETKQAEIEKEIPATEAPASQDSIDNLVRAIPEVKAREPEIPRPLLDSMAQNHGLPEIISTLTMLGIIPKPQEFQRIVLIRSGKRELADELDSKNLCFDPSMCEEPDPAHGKILGLDHNKFSPQIMSMMTPMMADRSYAAPHLVKRILITIEKQADSRIPIFFDADNKDVDSSKKLGIMPIMLLTAGLYAAMAKKSPELAATRLGQVVSKHPGLAAALASTIPMLFNTVIGEGAKGNFVAGMEQEIDSVTEQMDKRRQKPFLKVASNIGAFGNRAFLGVPAVYMASGMLQKSKNMNPDKQESKITRFIRRNPDIIGAAIALDSFLALSGKGTHGAAQAIKPHLSKLFKSASADTTDAVMDALVWPLAFGGKGLASRITGGVIDQAILAGHKKLLSKKDKQDRIN